MRPSVPWRRRKEDFDHLRERQWQYQTIFRRLHERADIVTLYRNQFIWGTQPNTDFRPRGDDWVLVRQIALH